MSQQQLVEEYHPPKKEDIGTRIVPGKYTILRVYFDLVGGYGEVVNIESEEGKFYTFSKVLRKQLTEMIAEYESIQGETVDGFLRQPIRVEVKQVKNYLTLV